MKQEFKNLQSTNYKDKLRDIQKRYIDLKNASPDTSFKDIIESDIHSDSFPSSGSPNQRTNAVIYSIDEISPTGLGYTDPTARFPYRSARGAEYFFIAYINDANAILVTTMKDRTAPSIIKA